MQCTVIWHWYLPLCIYILFFVCFFFSSFFLFVLPIPFCFSICLLSDIYKFDGIVDTSMSKSAL